MKIKTLRELKNKVDPYLAKCKEEEKIPTISGLCRVLNITRATFMNYATGVNPQAKPEVINEIKSLVLLCEEKLVEAGLEERGSAQFKQFLLKNNHGYRDKQEIELNSSVKLIQELDAEADKVIEQLANDARKKGE